MGYGAFVEMKKVYIIILTLIVLTGLSYTAYSYYQSSEKSDKKGCCGPSANKDMTKNTCGKRTDRNSNNETKKHSCKCGCQKKK
jgi:hypothetical protein